MSSVQDVETGLVAYKGVAVELYDYLAERYNLVLVYVPENALEVAKYGQIQALTNAVVNKSFDLSSTGFTPSPERVKMFDMTSPSISETFQTQERFEAAALRGEGLPKRQRTSTDGESEPPPTKKAKSISAELTKEAEQNLKKMIKTAVDKIRSLNGVVKENIRELSSDLLLSHELHIAVALASIRRSSDLILDGLDGATRAAVIGEIQHATYEPVKELLEESSRGGKQNLGSLVRSMTSILRSISRDVEEEMIEIALSLMTKHAMVVAAPSAVIIRSTQLILDTTEVRFRGTRDAIISCLRFDYQPPQDDSKPTL